MIGPVRGRGVGIYDDFPGFRVPAEADLREAIRSALVVPDTNVLLDLYRYNDSTRADMFEVLAGVGERLWVPHQVMREFWRNRLSVIAGRNSGAEQAVTELAALRDASVEAIRRWARTALVPQDERERLTARVDLLHAELAEALRAHAPAPIDVTGGAPDDPVLRSLEPLLDGKVGAAADPAAWRAAVAEGAARVARREPPGYLDADKAGSGLPEGATGDYLVWRQAVEEAAARGSDLLIVTGDQKADWWWRFARDLIGPRSELVAEFAAVAGGRLFLMRPADLLQRASALAVHVRGESVADAERIGEGPGPAWTADGVDALLAALNRGGGEHAAVLRAAAARGGRIDRTEVEEICGNGELRGIAPAVGRATRDLQEAGLVAPGVAPALVVDAGVFRVPAEIVAILAGPGT